MSTKKSNDPLITMEEWFSQATPSERDAMSALQLEYAFRGDNLGSQWWLVMQELGFKHQGTTYHLPESAPPQCKVQRYTGSELYEQMDCFAIPQLTSPFQEFPTVSQTVRANAEQESETKEWWRSMRDELIFRRFRTKVEGFQLNHLPPSREDSDSKPLGAITNKRKVSKDAGAELFMHKKRSTSLKRKEPTTTSTVKLPTIQEYAKHAAESCNQSSEITKQEAFLAAAFHEWKFLSVTNHSILLYGVGSKRSLLNRFADEIIEDGDSVIVIDGFHKDVTIDGILDLITTSWMRGEKLVYNRYDVHVGRHLGLRSYGSYSYPTHGDSSIIQKACSIAKGLAARTSESKRAYYLILHNIDGVGLRNAAAQEALAALVAHSSTLRGLNAFRLVASMDHVNTPTLLWDSMTLSQFRWIWKPVHTYYPHIEEVTQGTYADDISKATKRHRPDTAISSEHKAIFTVLKSLAPRHTEALQQLASLQANQLATASEKQSSTTDTEELSSSSSWVNYKTLFRQCQFKCIVHGDEQLRRLLQELKDHGVVEQNDGEDREGLSYRIPHGAKTLRDILDFVHTRSNND